MVIALLAVLALAGRDVLPLSPRTVSPSLELTSGTEGAYSVPSVRHCHIEVLLRLPELVLRHGQAVKSAHADLPLTNDDLRAYGTVNLSCGPAPPSSVGSERYFLAGVWRGGNFPAGVGRGADLLAGSV